MDKQTVSLILLKVWLNLLKRAIAADVVDDLVNLTGPGEGDNVFSDGYKQKQHSVEVLSNAHNTC